MQHISPTLARIRRLLEQADEIGGPERHAGHEAEIIRHVRVLIRELEAPHPSDAPATDPRVAAISRRADQLMKVAGDAGLITGDRPCAEATDLRDHTLIRMADRGA